MRYRLIMFILILTSCSQNSNEKKNNDCVITVKTLLQKDSNRLAINDLFKNGAISMLVDKSLDSIFGAYYFYPSGVLKSYKFFTLPTTYFYNEEYDSLGNLIHKDGGPLLMNFFSKIDSSNVGFTFLFPTLNKGYKNIKVRTNTDVQLEYPNLIDNGSFTNIKHLTFKLPVVKSFDKLQIIITGEVEDDCLNKKWTLIDTATFKNMKL